MVMSLEETKGRPGSFQLVFEYYESNILVMYFFTHIIWWEVFDFKRNNFFSWSLCVDNFWATHLSLFIFFSICPADRKHEKQPITMWKSYCAMLMQFLSFFIFISTGLFMSLDWVISWFTQICIHWCPQSFSLTIAIEIVAL